MRTTTTMALPRAALISLAALAAIQCAAAKKVECSEIKPGKLKSLAQDTHVLLKVDKKDTTGDDETQYENLCARYADSPTDRVKGLTIGNFVIDTDAMDNKDSKKAMDVAKKLGAEVESEWPTYILLKKGTQDASEGIKYGGEKTVEGVTNFVKEQVDVQVGSLIYYIDTLDKMAARWSSIDENGGMKAQLEKKFHAYVAKFMIFLYRGDAKEVAQMYGKVFSSVLEQGDGYVTKTKERLEGLIKSDSNMSKLKIEELSQRIYILEKFTDPVEVSAEDNRSYWFAILWNVALLGCMFFLVVGMLFSTEESTTEVAGDEKNEEVSSGDKKDSNESKDENEAGAETKKEQ
uniref:Endoplasmic reticulum resident protein 29 C-terminal domain-containing protein n=1 Tax=Odontella aurita TaxID=265563 RepID=A0A6U6E698_9STRA|mmetsp:Transcript_23979/g.70741  ORF Transcript_23979/g.70741 Transcript_23979/m.70741 type:complete len:348 (+) Transcript_23979:96-1139(+)